jgi:hypothetical protein
MMFVEAPLTHMGVLRPVVVDVTFMLFLVAGVAGVAGRRELTVLVVAVGGLALIARRLASSDGTETSTVVATALSMLVVALLAAAVLGPVLGHGRITRRRVEGAVVVYLLLALLWGMAYRLLTHFVPAAFNVPGADVYTLQYFSLMTLTTAGYGDIVPMHPLARSLAAAEALTGPLYLAILVARLVSEALAARGG